MSYCVNCGVELETFARKCPLCGVQVINPVVVIPETGERLYPELRQPPKKKPFKPGLFSLFIYSLFLAIPLIVTLVIDVKINGRVTWAYYTISSIILFWLLTISPFVVSSNPLPRLLTIDALAISIFLYILDASTGGVVWAWYPISAILLFWVVVGLPMFFKQNRPVIVIIFGCIGLTGYLKFIEELTNSGPWFYQMALPVVIQITLLSLGVAYLIIVGKVKNYGIVGTLFAALGILNIGVDLTINHYLNQTFSVGWSIVTLVAAIPLACVFFIIQTRIEIQVFLKKKFHL